MLPIPTIFMVSIGGLVLFSVVTLVSTGSITAVIVLLMLVAILGYVLMKMGVLDIKMLPSGLDIGFHEKAPAPAQSKMVTTKSLEQKEVFYVSGNDYTYDEAAAVCAAYESDLATYDQVNDAYSAGGEWCGYGWTQGGMALFPTQTSTWEMLQGETDLAKRTGCGRPGINGGYFDPQNKFGVNCYGIKPNNSKLKFPLPVPGTEPAGFDKMVDKFKSMLSKMSVSAFNRNGWSEWNAGAHLPTLKTA